MLVLAIPVFLFISGLEALVARWQGRSVHRLNDSVSNMSCGLVDQLVNAVVGTVFVLGFHAVHEVSPLDLESTSPWTWLLALLGVDLAYYTFHRLSHRVNVLWATHVVHHQSEEYNLTISLRQGTVATWVTWVFYLPLALVLPLPVFLVTHALFQVWQFLIHTRLVGTLGPLEWVLVTPSIHRVHHGRRAAEIDTNYGAS